MTFVLPRARHAARSMAVAALAVALWALPGGALAQHVKVLHQQGDLHALDEKGPAPLPKGDIPAATALQAGPPVKAEQVPELAKKALDHGAALSFNAREAVTLSSGATVKRAGTDAAPEFTLTGAAHLLIAGGDKDPAIELKVNGQKLRVKRAHLFFNGWSAPPTLRIVSGEAEHMAAPGTAAPAGSAAAPAGPAAPAIAKLAAGARLVLDPAGTKVEEKAADDPLLPWSQIAGHTEPGAYKRVGTANASDKKLAVGRYGKDLALTGEKITVYEGDEVRSTGAQKVELALDSKDKIVLTGDAKLKVELFGAKAQKPAFAYFLVGKMRSIFSPKDGPGAVGIRTPTATIGVKGTDLETLGSVANTDVSVFEGLVGVGDASGAGAIDVPAGFSTSVAAGAKPTPPVRIPPERMKEAGVALPPASKLEIKSPASGATVKDVKIDVAVEPAGAGYDVLLDDQPLPAADVPATLPEGAHKITVRGQGDAAKVTQTVSFTVDRTPPAIAPAVKLDALAVTEGAALSLAWSEALASAQVVIGQLPPIALALAADGKSGTWTPTPEQLKEGATPVKVTLTDKAGNAVTLDAKVTLQKKAPALPPTLAVTPAGEPILASKVPDLSVTADRDIASWSLTIDGVDATAKLPPAATPPGKTLAIAAALLGDLKDGDHAIVIKATDAQKVTGERKVTLRLSRPTTTVAAAKPPEPPRSAAVGGSARPSDAATMKRAYEGSVATKTGDLRDKTYVDDRGPFVYTTPSALPPLPPPGGSLYRAGPKPESVGGKLSDPAFRD